MCFLLILDKLQYLTSYIKFTIDKRADSVICSLNYVFNLQETITLDLFSARDLQTLQLLLQVE